MEKTDKTETRDFLKVESFSQLPFIRPTPVKEKGIRLFGKEFGGDEPESNITDTEETKDSSDTTGPETLDTRGLALSSNNSNGRKFECHYCCRNFPTSQALGGHQNAHKRERQHAKRLHLQSATMISDHHSHLYGHLINYHPLLASPPIARAPYHYDSRSNGFYGLSNYHSQSRPPQPPVNGSPSWRIPSVHSSIGDHSSSHQLSSMAGAASHHSQTRFGYQKTTMQDLDLHL